MTAVVDVQDVKNLLKRQGYEIVQDDGQVFRVQDESQIPIVCCLEGSVLFNTVICCTVPKLTREGLEALLDSENGVNTSSFRITRVEDGVRITLNNLCKLQELGADDEDDITSALNFLEIDVVKARDLLRSEEIG